MGGLLAVRVEIFNHDRSQSAYAFFALDTGATRTVINSFLLEQLGYKLDPLSLSGQMTTASGVASVKRMTVSRLAAMGHSPSNMSIIARELPPSALVDGLLGLDFIEGGRICLDTVSGQVELTRFPSDSTLGCR